MSLQSLQSRALEMEELDGGKQIEGRWSSWQLIWNAVEELQVLLWSSYGFLQRSLTFQKRAEPDTSWKEGFDLSIADWPS